MDSFIDKVISLESSTASYAVVTIVNGRGSLPNNIGGKAIITSDGIIWGTVGGGKIEQWAIKISQRLLEEKRDNFFEKLNLQTEVGMNCGGEVSLYYELHNNNDWNIAVFGAGHVAQAFIRTLLTLNCRVTCFDIRQEWLDKLPSSPNLISKCVEYYADGLSDIADNSYIYIMTMGYSYDLPVVELAIQNPNYSFIGGLGSEVKAKNVERELQKRNIEQSLINRYISPVGLSIGNNNPTEIAISLTAQLLEVRDKLKG